MLNFNSLLSKKNQTKIFLFGFFSLVIFLIIPIDGSFSRFFFTTGRIFLYSFFVVSFINRFKLNVFLKSVFLFSIIGSLIIGLPTSYGSLIDNYYFSMPQIEFKIKYVSIYFLPGLIIYIISRFQSPKLSLSNSFSFSETVLLPNRFIILFSQFFLAVFLLFIFGNIYNLSIISFFADLSFNLFKWYIVLIGFWNFKLGKQLFYSTIIIIGINLLVSFASGGRFGALENIILLVIGIFLSENSILKNLTKSNLYWMVPMGILSIGIVGITRTDIGRGGYNIILKEGRFSEFFQGFGNGVQLFFTDSDFRSKILENTSNRTKGAGALETVILYSPHPIKYRGVENIDNEVRSIFSIAFLQTDSRAEMDRLREKRIENELGTSAANRYGFYVTKENSVEWPVYADAYSRGGILVVLLYFFIAFIWFNFVEKVIRSIIKDRFKVLILQLVLMRIIYLGFTAKPLIMLLRESILYVSFAIFIIIFINLLSKVQAR